jgi:hypothetical protein
MLEYRPIQRNARVRQSIHICTGISIGARAPTKCLHPDECRDGSTKRNRRSGGTRSATKCELPPSLYELRRTSRASPTLRPTLDRTLSRLRFVHSLSRCVELIWWRNRRKMAKCRWEIRIESSYFCRCPRHHWCLQPGQPHG